MDEGEAVEDQGDDAQIEHAADQEHDEAEEPGGDADLDHAADRGALNRNRLRGDGRDEPGAVDAARDRRFPRAHHDGGEEGVHHQNPERDPQAPQPQGQLRRMTHHRDLGAEDAGAGHQREEAGAASVVDEVGEQLGRKAGEPGQDERPQRCVGGNIEDQKRPGSAGKSQQQDRNRERPGRHDEGEIAGKEILGRATDQVHCTPRRGRRDRATSIPARPRSWTPERRLPINVIPALPGYTPS